MEVQHVAPSTKLEISIDVVVDGRPVHIEARVAGEGALAQCAADSLSEAIANVIAQSVVASPSNTHNLAAASFISQKRQTVPPSPAMQWMQRNRGRINIGFGALLVALALLIPIIVPPAQRSDVLILTILFTLAGALLLFTAFLPGRSKAAAMDESQQAPSQQRNLATGNSSANAVRREQLLKPVAHRAPLKTGIGIALSVVFIVAGLLAPFLLGAANADERFLIMLGFVPITVIGFFMLAIFGRRYFIKLLPAANGNAAPAKATSAPAAKRAPVNRVPQNLEYRAIVPVAIISALILMIVVVVVVIYATVASVAR